MALTLMAKAMSKSERDKAMRVLRRNGYTGIKVKMIRGKRILHDKILPATYYEIWANR
jgi:hypothetical protein